MAFGWGRVGWLWDTGQMVVFFGDMITWGPLRACSAIPKAIRDRLLAIRRVGISEEWLDWESACAPECPSM